MRCISERREADAGLVCFEHRGDPFVEHASRIKSMKTIATALVTMLAVLAPIHVTAQTMYKCVQGEKTVYQAEPCPDTAKQDTLKPQSVAPASAGGTELDRKIEFMSTYRACADAISIWREEMAGHYAQWRSRNSAMVSRIESDRQLQTLYRQRVDAKRNGKASMCREVALELRGVKQ